jgi:dynein heavy chain
VDINSSYQQLFSAAKAELASQPQARQLALDEKQIFSRLELLAKRLDKLVKMFTTIHQFSSLEQHTHITGRWRGPPWQQLRRAAILPALPWLPARR